MRIQHNIAALNSYRNLTNNNSAVSKNLEKLSSGYRINRAGDDAAGLAISEKMRAQITGLKTAQKNANDGISLVQTAEGAMTEVHSMLNRMVELANQSANGTYADDVDRENLQKEVASLKDEIDRIADSTNFNGINLLDGSLDSTVNKTVSQATFLNQKKLVLDDLEGKYLAQATDDDKKAYETDGFVQLHKDAGSSAKTSFEVDLDHMDFAGVDSASGKLQLWTGNAADDKGTVGVNNVLAFAYEATDSNGDKHVDAEEIAKGIMKALEATDNKVKLSFTDPDGGASKEVEYEVSLSEDGKTLRFDMTDDGFKTAADFAKDMQEKATADGVTDDDKAKYLGLADNLFRGNFHVGVHDGTNWTNQSVSATTTITAGTASSELQPAIATFDFVARAAENGNKVNIKDGAGLKVGDTYYVWAGSDDTLKGEYGDNVKTVDIRDLVDENGDLKHNLGSDWSDKDNRDILTNALERLTVAAADNDMFHVQINNQGDILIFTEKSDNPSDADLTTYKGLQEQLQSFEGIKANVTTTKAKGSDLNLQIGDTSDEFNRLAVSVKDMHASTMGIGDVDISTAASAAEAVSKIKNAINYVSSTRGDLGAIQNRLEHTINNLSVATENITAAESRIRDVDMAEEMMAYTKNNILVQAAQAMLAQANQVPQGVLQLLQ